MTNIIPFPLTRESRARMALMAAPWAVEANRHLIEFTGWLFPEGPPAWLGEAWWRTVSEHRRGRPEAEPHNVNWRGLWTDCIAGLDGRHDAMWMRAVNVSLREMEGGAA
jgi:hypothetical protein